MRQGSYATRRLRGPRLLSLLLLASMLLAVPFTTGAQVGAEAPSGFLVKTAAHDETLCSGETIVYTLSLFDTSSASVAPYRATISDTIPLNTSFAGHDGAGLSYDGGSNTLIWTPSIDPSNPTPLPPTVVFSVTVGSALPNGTQIVNVASGTLDTTPVSARVVSEISCASPPPPNPDDYPSTTPSTPDEEQEEPVPHMEESTLEVTEPATDSLLLEPELEDRVPPGYHQIHMPLLRSPATATSMALPPAQLERALVDQPAADIGPIVGLPKCDIVYPWVMRHAMSEATYQADATKLDVANYRPISVSANGSGADARFAHVWIKDNRYGKNWALRHALTGGQYQTEYENYKAAGYKAIVVDMYGTTASPRYAAIWVKDPMDVVGKHGVGETTMQNEIDSRAAQGYRPLWVSGLGSPTNNSPLFSGLWVKDVLTGTMRLDLTAEDISYNGVARQMVDQGYRMTQLSGYQTQEGTRYAAVWVKGGDCPQARWEAFRDEKTTQVQVKASAQRAITAVKTVSGGEFTLKPNELGTVRIARIKLRHVNTAGELTRIAPEHFGQFQNGAILVLQADYGHRVTVRDEILGNINLRNWKGNTFGARGQSFELGDYQYRLVLQYNAGLQRWVELQRNNISPDYYWPATVDEFYINSDRRYNSLWRAGPVDRVWTIKGTPLAGDNLDAFDVAMQTYMQRLNVPNGSLALTVNGKLVLARGYSWQPSNVAAIQPDARFRLASVSKPLTAIGIMELVEDGLLNLDTRLKDIPGFDSAILKSNLWVDDDIDKVTVRHLLSHRGGWDRAITDDPMLDDFDVCSNGVDELPTTLTKILNFARTLPFDHEPGEAYAYSNFGYALLGLVIEHVSGQSYSSYMQSQVLGPMGTSKTALGNNLGGLPGEVRYYRPNNAMGASVLGFDGTPLGRQICNSSHADTVHVSYGTNNIIPMAAHGGWVSTGPDLARVLVGLENNTVLGPDRRNEMWSRQANREWRVGLYDAQTNAYTDYTLHTRKNVAGMTLDNFDSTQDLLFIGQGLVRFSRMTFDFSPAGQGYNVRLMYPKRGGGWGILNNIQDGITEDGTNNFSQDGRATITPPDDWEAVVISALDPQPKYYLMLQTQTNPTVEVKINQIDLNGENDYALGWHSSGKTYTMRYNSGNANLADGAIITGAQSKASAKILDVQEGLASGTVILQELVGGSFRPGEQLLVGLLPAAKVTQREWVRTVDVNHGGLLWGTTAKMKHRADGVNWVVLLNQDNYYNPYWYLPSDQSIFGEVDRLIGLRNGSWPNIDLFGNF